MQYSALMAVITTMRFITVPLMVDQQLHAAAVSTVVAIEIGTDMPTPYVQKQQLNVVLHIL